MPQRPVGVGALPAGEETPTCDALSFVFHAGRIGDNSILLEEGDATPISGHATPLASQGKSKALVRLPHLVGLADLTIRGVCGFRLGFGVLIQDGIERCPPRSSGSGSEPHTPASTA